MIFHQQKTERGQKRTREGVSGGSGGYLRVRLFEDLLIAVVIALKPDPRFFLGAKAVLVLASSGHFLKNP